jgi:hypothetical protein
MSLEHDGQGDEAIGRGEEQDGQGRVAFGVEVEVFRRYVEGPAIAHADRLAEMGRIGCEAALGRRVLIAAMVIWMSKYSCSRLISDRRHLI